MFVAIFLYLFICSCIFVYVIVYLYFFMYFIYAFICLFVSLFIGVFLLYVCELIYFGDHDTDEALLDSVKGLVLNSHQTILLVHFIPNCDCISVSLFRMTTTQM
jgi:hypothetical protein